MNVSRLIPLAARGAALFYGFVVALRNVLYDRQLFSVTRVSLPVVSIGNISVGGSGKTPLTIAVVEGLKVRGFSPTVLSRGYGGSLRGPVLITEAHTASEVGDEPLLIQARTGVPVIIAKRRVEGAELIKRASLGNCIVLDDGFQHRALARTVDIVLIDVSTAAARSDFINGMLLPAGKLREPRERALARADLVVFSHRVPRDSSVPIEDAVRCSVETGSLRGKNSHNLFESFVRAQAPTRIFHDGYDNDTASLQNPFRKSPLPAGSSCVAFCGIANPEAFLKTLESQHFTIARADRFPDHYRFTAEDVRKIAGDGDLLPLICTEKDMVKIRELARGPVPEGVSLHTWHSWFERMYVVAVDAVVEPEDKFFDQVVAAIESYSSGDAQR